MDSLGIISCHFIKNLKKQLLIANSFVDGPNYSLNSEEHDNNSYPVDGWYWFDNLDSAMLALSNVSDVATVTMRQAKLALFNSGLLTNVNGIISTLGEAAQISGSLLMK